MKYKLIGQVMPAVEMLLGSGESVYTQSGGMCWMSEGIDMSTNTRGGFMKGLGRMFAGESMFMATYTSRWEDGMIAFAATVPGEIYPLVKDIFYATAAQIRSMIERTPPEISSEILHNGIYLTGGASFTSGVDQFFANEVNVRVNTTTSAQKTVAAGIGYLSEHPKLAARYAAPIE